MIRTLNPADEIPGRSDGQQWPFAMLHRDQTHGDLCTVADTNTELLGALIDGYADLPATDRAHHLDRPLDRNRLPGLPVGDRTDPAFRAGVRSPGPMTTAPA